MRTRRTASLAIAVVVLALAPAAAQAGTLLLAPVIQGAGTVTDGADLDCTKDNGFNDDASSRCGTTTLIDGPTVWLQAVPSNRSGWTFAGWTGCDQTREQGAGLECGIVPPPTGEAERNPVARFADTEAPAVTLAGLPSGRDAATTVAPTFSSSDTLATFRCRFDGAEFAPCASGTEYTLVDGPHTFSVVAVDPSSNLGAEQAVTWEVDAAPPTVTLTGGPAEGSATATRNAAFDISASADAKTTTCRLNGVACSLPILLPSLADGAYALVVTVSDGLREASATRTWTVDTVAPDTTVDKAFKLGASESNVTYECSVDGRPFAACLSPAQLNGLALGKHTLAVRARDRAGSVDATPATHSWEITRPIAFTVPYFVEALRRTTTFTSLAVKGVPKGATVKVTCTGGCPRKAQTLKAKKAGTVQLPAFRRRPFRVGAKLTIRVSAPGYTPVSKTFTFRADRRPRITTKTLAS